MNTLYELIISEKPEFLDSGSCVVSIDEITNICNNYIALEKDGRIVKTVKNKKSVSDILLCLSEVFGISVAEMKQKSRKTVNVTARQMFYKYTCDNRVLGGLRERGNIFKQDHATVLHGKRKINDLLYTKDHYTALMWNKFNFALKNQTPQNDDKQGIDL